MASEEEYEEYVLYIGNDRSDATKFCPGSRQALDIVDKKGLHEEIVVQSVDALRQSVAQLPVWLKGTPTLVSRTTRKAMTGTAAIEHLRRLAAKPTNETPSVTEHNMDGMIAATESLHLGAESNFEPLQVDDAFKYDESRKVTEDDLQKLLERRKATTVPVG